MVNARLRDVLSGLVAVVALAFAGCGGPVDAPGDGTAARPRIALVMKSLANEFFETMAEGARAHHEAYSDEYDLVINGTRNESDLAQQVALVEQMVASGSDAIRRTRRPWRRPSLALRRPVWSSSTSTTVSTRR